MFHIYWSPFLFHAFSFPPSLSFHSTKYTYNNFQTTFVVLCWVKQPCSQSRFINCFPSSYFRPVLVKPPLQAFCGRKPSWVIYDVRPPRMFSQPCRKGDGGCLTLFLFFSFLLLVLFHSLRDVSNLWPDTVTVRFTFATGLCSLFFSPAASYWRRKMVVKGNGSEKQVVSATRKENKLFAII